MSKVQDDFADAALPDILEYAGQDCTYTPPSGDPVSLVAVLDLITTEVDQMREGRRAYRSARVTFSKDPAGDYGGVQNVSLSATITVDASGEVFSISDVLAEFPGWITVRATSSGVMSRDARSAEVHRMTVIPSGTISRAMQLGRALLADCQAFRDLVSPALDQAGALARIHYNGLPAPPGDFYTAAELTALRPFALIGHNPNHGFRSEADDISGDRWNWTERGKLLVKIERTAVEVVNKLPSYDSFLDFQNAVGGIITNMYGLVGSSNYLGATAISILLGPYGVGEDDSPGEGVWEAVELELEYKGVST